MCNKQGPTAGMVKAFQKDMTLDSLSVTLQLQQTTTKVYIAEINIISNRPPHDSIPQEI